MKTDPFSVPVRRWVPHWLGVVTAFVIMLPISLMSGTYTGSTIEISGTLGVLSEDIRMAYYATSAGMVVAYPLVPRIRALVSTKTVLLTDLLIQVFISFICASTGQMDIIIVCSFLIGMLKAFAMMEIIYMTRPFFSPNNIRSEFYSWFYPIVFSAGQVSMALTAQLAYQYQWQYMYYFIMLLLLLAIAFVLLFFRYSPHVIRIPYRDIDWKSMLVAAALLLFPLYIVTYGKTLEWFDSSRITAYALALPPLLWIFVYRQETRKKPYLHLEILNNSKTLIGYSYIIITLFFSSTSTLVTNYANYVIHIDNVHANELYLWLIPGFVAGGFIAFWWLRLQRWRFRYLIAGGMGCFTLYLALLYFGISPDAAFESLYFPMILKGTGTMIIFIAIGVYVVEDLSPQMLINNTFFLITCRSVLSPAAGAAFFSNFTYRLQQSGIDTLARSTTASDPLAAQHYEQTLHSALTQGHGYAEAAQLAANSLYGTLQTQGMLLGLKTIFGYLLIAAIAVTVISAFIPFHKTLKVAIVKTGEDMV